MVGAALLHVQGNHSKTHLSGLKTQVSHLLDWTERNRILGLTMWLSAACQSCNWVSKKLQLTVEVHGSISDCGRLGKGKLVREEIICQYLEGKCCDLKMTKGRDPSRYLRLLHA